jgi:dolichyl-diphosphooligosaccharide--protein glycosyltransferase
MYKLCYYRTWEVDTAYGKPKGYDNVRNANPGYKNFKLHYFTEAFTSERWIVRIYRRNNRTNREAIELIREGDYKKYLDQDALPEALTSQSPYSKKQRRA